jgi:tRNA (uracil-5-)-methyltransferase
VLRIDLLGLFNSFLMEIMVAGLHRKTLYALLNCGAISKLVYVSCNPETLVNDMKVLVTPARAAKRAHQAPGKARVKANVPKVYIPFVPCKACPVDMFPHTDHVELVVLLERILP